MMRKLRFPIVLLCAVLILGGCASQTGGESPNKKITLTLWYWNRSLDDSLLAEAEQKFPNIQLNAQKIGGDYKSKLKTTLAAGSGEPDIVAINDWVTELFPNQDRFWDLYELGAKDVESDYLDWKLKLGLTPEGKLIALPMDTGPTALFYRADLFEKAGLPSDPEEVHAAMGTWEEYFEAGKQLQEKLGKGVKLLDNIGTVFTQVNAQSDTVYFEEDDTFIGDTDRSSVRKAWDLAVKASRMGLLANANGGTSEWNAAMNNGSIASFVGAVWNKEILMQAAPDTAGKWRIARAPGGDGNNGGSFLSILKSSKHPQEAYELIEWLQNPDNQLRSFLNMNLFPSTLKTLQMPDMIRPEEFFGGQATGEIFAEAARNVKPKYFGGKYTSVNGIMNRNLLSVALSGKDPDKTWTDAIARAKKELLR